MTYLLEAALDTLKTLPILLAVLLLIELAEHRLGHRLQHGLTKLGRWGPAIGAAVGALPQCGGAVVASELYAARALGLGTLIAVYLATSDEAVPILIASPGHAAWLGPLLATKVVIAVVAGYGLDYGLARRPSLALAGGGAQGDVTMFAQPTDAALQACANPAYADRACLDESLRFPALFAHAAKRAARVALYLTATSAILNFATASLWTATGAGVLFHDGIVQILVSAAFGLIPSCAPSVAMVELFIKGALGFPGLIAGLCANAGAGLVVLAHEAGWRTVARVASLLFVISLAAGLAISLL